MEASEFPGFVHFQEGSVALISEMLKVIHEKSVFIRENLHFIRENSKNISDSTNYNKFHQSPLFGSYNNVWPIIMTLKMKRELPPWNGNLSRSIDLIISLQSQKHDSHPLCCPTWQTHHRCKLPFLSVLSTHSPEN